MTDLTLEDCIRYLVQGHYIFQHGSNDGESINPHYRITGITKGHVDGYIPYPLDRCVFASLRYKDYQYDNFTLYALNPAEYNPRKPVEETIAYGLQSIGFNHAIGSLSNHLWDLPRMSTPVDMQPLITLTASTLQEIHTAQARARAAYLSG